MDVRRSSLFSKIPLASTRANQGQIYQTHESLGDIDNNHNQVPVTGRGYARSSSTPVITTEEPPPIAQRIRAYDEVCSGLTFLPISLSPTRAHVENKWGRKSKRWTLWSLWDTRVVGLPIFNRNWTFGQSTVGCKKMALADFVNCTLDRLLEPVEFRFREHNFIAFRVVQRKTEEGYLPYSQRIELEAIKLKFDGEDRSTCDPKYPMSLHAGGGLAQVLRAVAQYSDIFIISGGYEVLYDHNSSVRSLFDLNLGRGEHTYIARICDASVESEDDVMCLLEKIQPKLDDDDRYQFTYRVQRNATRREVVRHKRFVYEEFCQNVTDTLAYSKNRWEFPVPLVKETQARATFEILLSPNFTISDSARATTPSLTPNFSDDGSSAENEDNDGGIWFTASSGSSPEVLKEKEKKQVRFQDFASRSSNVLPRRQSHVTNRFENCSDSVSTSDNGDTDESSPFPYFRAGLNNRPISRQPFAQCSNTRPSYESIQKGKNLRGAPRRRNHTTFENPSFLRNTCLIIAVLLGVLTGLVVITKMVRAGCNPRVVVTLPNERLHTQEHAYNNYLYTLVTYVRNYIMPFLNPSTGLQKIFSTFGYDAYECMTNDAII